MTTVVALAKAKRANKKAAENSEDAPRRLGFDMDRMNAEYALVLISSKSLILHQQPDAAPDQRIRILTITAFQDWFSNRPTEIRTADGEVKMVTWAAAWHKNRDRRQYRGIEFHPNPDGVEGTPEYFNTWQGFDLSPAPKPNGYAVFRDHLLNNICGGDQGLYEWVFAFFAHIFQRPRERPGVSLVLRGGQGSGKTIVGSVIGSLLSVHYLLVDNSRYLTGNFNAHMASCLLLQADEAVWAGDKQAEGRLKSLVTSDVQMIEAKGVDPIAMRNYVRLIMTSNEDWVVPAGKDERRFCVLDVDPRCAQNSTYFAEMQAEMANGGREALLHDLLTFDLDRVNLRQIPMTKALLDQKFRSLGPIEAWWLDRLQAGAPMRSLDDWQRTVTRDAVYDDYVAASERAGVKRRAGQTDLGAQLHKLIPGLSTSRPRLASNEAPYGRRVRCYELPSLAECRAAFEAAMNQPITWEDIDPAPD